MKKNTISLPTILQGIKSSQERGVNAYFSGKENERKTHYKQYFGGEKNPDEVFQSFLQYGKEHFDTIIHNTLINILLDEHYNNPPFIKQALAIKDLMNEIIINDKPLILREIKDELITFLSSHSEELFDHHLKDFIYNKLPHDCISNGILQTFRTKQRGKYVFTTYPLRRYTLRRIATIERTTPGTMPSDQYQLTYLANKTIQSLTYDHDKLKEIYFSKAYYEGFICIVQTSTFGEDHCILNTTANTSLIHNLENPITGTWYTIKAVDNIFVQNYNLVSIWYCTATVHEKSERILLQESQIITQIDGYLLLDPVIINISRGKILCSKVKKEGKVTHQLFSMQQGKREHIDSVTNKVGQYKVIEVYELSQDMTTATLSIQKPGIDHPQPIVIQFKDFNY